MYIDSLLEFSRAQALSASGASTNIIDLGSDRDIGPGRPLWVVVAVAV
ncbi:Bbp16 family capsid cement protein, partial [Burkholderia cenocepacia]